MRENGRRHKKISVKHFIISLNVSAHPFFRLLPYGWKEAYSYDVKPLRELSAAPLQFPDYIFHESLTGIESRTCFYLPEVSKSALFLVNDSVQSLMAGQNLHRDKQNRPHWILDIYIKNAKPLSTYFFRLLQAVLFPCTADIACHML